jgi:acyl carrier protein
MKIADRVKQIVFESGCIESDGTDASRVTLETRFIEGRDEDALEILSAVMMCEAEFEIDIADEEAELCKTVGDLILCIHNKVRAKPLYWEKYEL